MFGRGKKLHTYFCIFRLAITVWSLTKKFVIFFSRNVCLTHSPSFTCTNTTLTLPKYNYRNASKISEIRVRLCYWVLRLLNIIISQIETLFLLYVKCMQKTVQWFHISCLITWSAFIFLDTWNLTCNNVSHGLLQYGINGWTTYLPVLFLLLLR